MNWFGSLCSTSTADVSSFWFFYFALIVVEQELFGAGRLQSKPSSVINAASSGMITFCFAVGERAVDSHKHQQCGPIQG